MRTTANIGVENCTYSFDSLFTYIVPAALEPYLKAGMRVFVPFGRSQSKRQGFVFSVEKKELSEEDINKLKTVSELIDSSPVMSAELIALALWIRERTFCTYFTAAKSVLPGGMCTLSEKTYILSEILPEGADYLSDEAVSVLSCLKNDGGYISESKLIKSCGSNVNVNLLRILESKGFIESNTEVFSKVNDLNISLCRLSEAYLADSDSVKLTKKQQNVVNFLLTAGFAAIKELCYYTGVTPAVIKLLINKGICETYETQVFRTPVSEYNATGADNILSDEQNAAFNKLYEAYLEHCFHTALLFGVTGSGKTSVYLKLIDSVLADGKTALVLVPEIALTPQTFSLFKARFGDDIAVLHSGLSLGERHDEWKRIKKGLARVVIGTRSAIFAPLENIGVIIIDEEQEHTYKSEINPRYDAREAAKFRCAVNNALLVFASATPSVSTYAKALSGQYMLCELKNRYGSAVLPEVLKVDMTDKTLLDAFFAISNPLAEEIQKNLENSEQTILLVNRRGYNTFVVCCDCKHVISCPKCSISLTYHSANNRLMCHYCGYSTEYTEKCPVCSAKNIRYSGFGTQRVEMELQTRFPSARILRMDADTTTMKNAHAKALSAFANGDYDILLGTQMVAKGLDFGNVTLVGVLSADKELYNNDFKSSERTFDLITQVAGRAGRGNKAGRAVIQTVDPDNSIIDIAAAQDYESFFKEEIAVRKSMIYPPFCDICVVSFTSESESSTRECALSFFDSIVQLNKNKYPEQKIIVLGPMAPRVMKVNNNFRQRIIIKCKNNNGFRCFMNELLLDALNNKAFKDVLVFADINPENTE